MLEKQYEKALVIYVEVHTKNPFVCLIAHPRSAVLFHECLMGVYFQYGTFAQLTNICSAAGGITLLPSVFQAMESEWITFSPFEIFQVYRKFVTFS